MFLKLGQRQLSCTERRLNRVGACKGNATCWCMHSNLFEVIIHPSLFASNASYLRTLRMCLYDLHLECYIMSK